MAWCKAGLENVLRPQTQGVDTVWGRSLRRWKLVTPGCWLGTGPTDDGWFAPLFLAAGFGSSCKVSRIAVRLFVLPTTPGTLSLYSTVSSNIVTRIYSEPLSAVDSNRSNSNKNMCYSVLDGHSSPPM